ncbi:hypothetical protein DWB61_13500 [Ancylomarina euxinus]|uniref:Porin n=1 Tax=Ancylomarina euxinus TaxID=2283627 RepID=A0A425XYR7_9BACT|nr:hypothetical protein [Ancylomarina euxinus]MCZ4695737.1 hypothetical protein [Ancylomarina euxinus]MUP16190.1 hypothetical protein [Ancylomarina euxinus]RRG20051.1 hypothetical protein DWB61_13500 [Ancylomarina euxinus]
MRKCFVLFFLIFLNLFLFGQDKNWFLNGYLKDMQMIYYVEPTHSWTNQNLLHNRLNFKWYPSSYCVLVAEVRNRFFTGKLVHDIPGYSQFIDRDNGFWDLSSLVIDSDGAVFHSMIDRVYLDYSLGDWQIRFGRQRINWGINLVWNPNDVFNTYSFLNFDYEERPGTDALKVQYYTSETSSLELVYQIGKNGDERALATRFRFNKWNYDFQLLGGWIEEDLMLGAGWAGDIYGGGFRGEVTWFVPMENRGEEALLASVSGDYSFSNSLMLHAGFLYNSVGTTGPIFQTGLFEVGEASPRGLSKGRYAIFGQISYPLTPLFTTSFSLIANPSDGSFVLNPSLSYSLVTNLDLLLVGQYFFGDDFTEYGDSGQFFFLRLKWSL